MRPEHEGPAPVQGRTKSRRKENEGVQEKINHSTQDSRVVPHRGTDWAALWLTAQIGRDAVLSESYGRGWGKVAKSGPHLHECPCNLLRAQVRHDLP